MKQIALALLAISLAACEPRQSTRDAANWAMTHGVAAERKANELEGEVSELRSSVEALEARIEELESRLD